MDKRDVQSCAAFYQNNYLETFYLDRYSPAYVVSASQPSTQGKYDFWFQITGTVVMP